ncbi:hypothetical protein [Erwinia oleae]|uniref:hypothetical protein n=1 Tax=Erwinia oleae TaxID=796334 RepID=UPI000551D7F9|nr:hypothetical protein [Erwinia oleae]
MEDLLGMARASKGEKMNVRLCTIESPEHPMDGELASQTEMLKNGPVNTHDLKVFKGKVSDQLFPETGFKQVVTFIVDGWGQADFYYVGKDDECYRFKTRP